MVPNKNSSVSRSMVMFSRFASTGGLGATPIGDWTERPTAS
jgi:hypothetical protein